MLAGVIPSVVLFATQTVAGARAIDPPVPPESAASARAGTERSNSRCPDTVHAARIRDYTAPRLVRRHASCQASRGLVTSMPNKDETKTRIGEKYDTLRGPLQRLEGFGRPGGDQPDKRVSASGQRRPWPAFSAWAVDPSRVPQDLPLGFQLLQQLRAIELGVLDREVEILPYRDCHRPSGLCQSG